MKMHQMAIGLLLVGGCFVVLSGCAPDDDDRCRSGWRYESGDCLLVEDDTDTTTSSEPDTAEDTCIDTDTNSDTDTLPSGMGDACEDNDDCACKDASYCAFDPNTQTSSCAVSDCLDRPSICPEGLVCCAFSSVPAYPSMCIPQATYDEVKNSVGC